MNRPLFVAAVLSLFLTPALAQPRPGKPKSKAEPRVAPKALVRKAASPAPRSAPKSEDSAAAGVSLEEARRSVEMLNEVYQLTLQEIHRRFPVGSGQPVVAALLIRDIQKRMNTRGGAQSRFLAVDLRAMNPDHEPKDPFEREAAEKLAAGARRWEVIEPGRLRMATVVPLGGTCFPCHSTSTGGVGRAAISWTVPLAK